MQKYILLFSILFYWAANAMAQRYPTVMIENIDGKDWYYFVDSNKQEVFDKRRYEWAENFNWNGLWPFYDRGYVKINGQEHVIDTLGNIIFQARNLSELNEKTLSLDLEYTKEITSIPAEIYKYPQLKYIELGGDISEINADAFANFPNLQKLVIVSGVQLKVDKYAFRGLKNLKYLSLFANEAICTVDKEAFKDLVDLEYLTLNNLKLSDLDSNTFANCTKIIHLHIECLAGKLNTDIFKPLQKLIYLGISHYLGAGKHYETSLKTILPNTVINVAEYNDDMLPIEYYYNEAGQLYIMPAFFGIANKKGTTKVIQRVGNTATIAYCLVQLYVEKSGWSLFLVPIVNGKPTISNMIPQPSTPSNCNTHSHDNTFSNAHYLLHESGFYQFKTIAFNVDKNQNIAEFSKQNFDGTLIWKKELPLDSIYKVSEKNYARQASFLTPDEAGNLYFLWVQGLEDRKNYRNLAIHKNLYCLDSKTGNILWEKELGETHAYKVFDFMSDNNNGLYWLISNINTNQFTLEHLNNGQISWSLAIQKNYLSPNIIYTRQQYHVDSEGNIYLLLTGRQPLNTNKKGINPQFSPINLFKISPKGKVIWHQKYGKFLLPTVQEKYMAETELFYPDKDITLENNKLYIYFTSSKLRDDILTTSLPKPTFFPNFDNEIGLSEGYNFVLVFDANTGKLEAGQYLDE